MRYLHSVLIEVSVCFFHPSSSGAPAHAPLILFLSFPSSHPPLSKWYLEVNNFTWCSAPLPLTFFVFFFHGRIESVCGIHSPRPFAKLMRQRRWVPALSFHSPVHKEIIYADPQMASNAPHSFCPGAEVCDNVGLN